MEDPAEPEKQEETGTPTDALGASLQAMGVDMDPDKIMEALPAITQSMGGIRAKFDQIHRICYGNALMLEKIARKMGFDEGELEVWAGVEPIG